MQVTIINLYNDIIPEKSGFLADHGQSFFLSSNQFKILFDTGTNGKILLHNMEQVGLSPNDIEVVILSHGHYDHTGGLRKLLEQRTRKEPLQIIAHPDVTLPKAHLRKRLLRRQSFMDVGFPETPEALAKKCFFNYTREFSEIVPCLFITGEISERPYQTGISSNLYTKQNGAWVAERMKDDMSLVLKTKTGLVVLCGCCHAGLLNTLRAIKRHFPEEKFQAILGGTHMYHFTRAEVAFVVQKLEDSFDKPKLFFNHCSGLNTIELLKELYGEAFISDCLVGAKFVYNC